MPGTGLGAVGLSKRERKRNLSIRNLRALEAAQPRHPQRVSDSATGGEAA